MDSAHLYAVFGRRSGIGAAGRCDVTVRAARAPWSRGQRQLHDRRARLELLEVPPTTPHPLSLDGDPQHFDSLLPQRARRRCAWRRDGRRAACSLSRMAAPPSARGARVASAAPCPLRSFLRDCLACDAACNLHWGVGGGCAAPVRPTAAVYGRGRGRISSAGRAPLAPSPRGGPSCCRGRRWRRGASRARRGWPGRGRGP